MMANRVNANLKIDKKSALRRFFLFFTELHKGF